MLIIPYITFSHLLSMTELFKLFVLGSARLPAVWNTSQASEPISWTHPYQDSREQHHTHLRYLPRGDIDRPESNCRTRHGHLLSRSQALVSIKQELSADTAGRLVTVFLMHIR